MGEHEEIRIELTGLVGEYAQARATAWAHGLTFVSYKEWLEQRHAVKDADLAALQAENARLREALVWYADSRNYSKSEMWIDPANGQECHIQVVSIFVDVRAIEALGGE